MRGLLYFALCISGLALIDMTWPVSIFTGGVFAARFAVGKSTRL